MLDQHAAAGQTDVGCGQECILPVLGWYTSCSPFWKWKTWSWLLILLFHWGSIIVLLYVGLPLEKAHKLQQHSECGSMYCMLMVAKRHHHYNSHIMGAALAPNTFPCLHDIWSTVFSNIIWLVHYVQLSGFSFVFLWLRKLGCCALGGEQSQWLPPACRKALPQDAHLAPSLMSCRHRVWSKNESIVRNLSFPLKPN